MPTPKTIWVDSHSKEHSSEQEALRADLRYVINERLDEACEEREEFDLKSVECWGPDYIRPVTEYFVMLLQEAEERSRKHG